MSTRVLVVEDDADTRLIYRLFLESNGFAVDEAADGIEALAKANASPPRLCVLDIGLPRLDGFEVARRLRSSSRTAAIPIIAVSAHFVSGYEAQAREAGCEAALAKPCMAHELLATARRVLSETALRRFSR